MSTYSGPSRVAILERAASELRYAAEIADDAIDADGFTAAADSLDAMVADILADAADALEKERAA